MEDRKSIFSGRGNSLNLLIPSEDNNLFVGYADKEAIEFNETSRTVSIEGRDLTSLFTDAKYLGKPVALTVPVNIVIENLVKQQDSTKSMEVINLLDEDLPILSKLGSDLSTTSSLVNPKRNSSFWDMIQDIIDRAGLICYVDRDKLVINKPRNLFKKQKVKNFIYGKNLSKLSLERELGRHKGFNILVRSMNLKDKKLYEAKIPKDSGREDLGGGIEVTIPQLDSKGKKIDPQKPAPYLTHNIADVFSKEKLIEIGESIYEELSRQQIEGSLETKEMEIPETPYLKDKEGSYTPFSSRESEPVNFSTIRNGTAIQIFIDISDLEKIRTISSMQERKKYLRLQGFSSKVSSALAESLNRASYTFYTKSVNFRIDQDSGFSMDIKFINFIELDNKGLGL